MRHADRERWAPYPQIIEPGRVVAALRYADPHWIAREKVAQSIARDRRWYLHAIGIIKSSHVANNRQIPVRVIPAVPVQIQIISKLIRTEYTVRYEHWHTWQVEQIRNILADVIEFIQRY